MENVKVNNHPDDVFGPSMLGKLPVTGVPGIGKTEFLSTPMLLTEEVNALAASLNVPTSKGNDPYDPDAFVVAIRKEHDKLVEISRDLRSRLDALKIQEREIQRREEEVAFREKRVAAHESLQAQMGEGRRGFLYRLFGR